MSIRPPTAIAATDFFSVEVLTWVGIVRYHVFFVIDLETRLVEIAGITNDLHQAGVERAVRGLLDAVDGFLKDAASSSTIANLCLGLTSRDCSAPLVSGTCGRRLAALISTPSQSASSARFGECLSRIIPLGERHLRFIVAEYVGRYNSERNHQGIGNRPLSPALVAPANDSGRAVCRRERLGGLLNFNHRDAA